MSGIGLDGKTCFNYCAWWGKTPEDQSNNDHMVHSQVNCKIIDYSTFNNARFDHKEKLLVGKWVRTGKVYFPSQQNHSGKKPHKNNFRQLKGKIRAPGIKGQTSHCTILNNCIIGGL